MSTTSTRRKTIIAAGAVVAFAATGFAVQQTAMAGTNGQQIEFCDRKVNAISATATGLNYQNHMTTETVDLSNTPQNGECVTLPNRWWKGDVNITWTIAEVKDPTPGHIITVLPFRTSRCHVPVNQESDITTCEIPER
jgi:hypothetical protein